MNKCENLNYEVIGNIYENPELLNQPFPKNKIKI